MCGLAGFLCQRAPDGAVAAAMAAALIHRGPDSGGVWCDPDGGLALAHRRLAILDVSGAGAQPMLSACQNFAIALNGEIYNHLDLRREIDGGSNSRIPWRGHSDTETLLEGIALWGMDEALRRCVGMFAVALWDRSRRELVLARDRMGEKPLYYGWQGDVFLFGSELKALAAHPAWRSDIDRDALALFMRYGYVPLPYSIWRGVRKLLPGTHLTITTDTPSNVFPTPNYYWRALNVADAKIRTDLDDRTAVVELESLLNNAIARQMVADVPLGAFLSGGVDSSTVAALMQSQSERPVKTFTIGFAEEDYNEAAYAKRVARHLGTDHTEIFISPDDSLKVIPRLPDMYDEPFGDVSQIPTHLVAAMARQHVKVSLTGDGADELFGGYNRYLLGYSMWHKMRPMPIGLRRLAGQAILSVRPSQWDNLGRLIPGLRHPMVGDRAHKLAGILTAKGPEEVYRWLVSHERDPDSLVVDGMENRSDHALWADREMCILRSAGTCERMMFNDLIGYLTDDVLCKVDRAAMAASLETRVPFLDHRVIEFALQLPMNMKIRGGQGKWLLRQVLYQYVPKRLIERPKQGFGVPIDAWLRGPLREWAECLLDESRLRREGYLNPKPIQKKWREHVSGQRNWQYWLWNVLMFQAWHERWRCGS